jgi:hypothetical protein
VLHCNEDKTRYGHGPDAAVAHLRGRCEDSLHRGLINQALALDPPPYVALTATHLVVHCAGFKTQGLLRALVEPRGDRETQKITRAVFFDRSVVVSTVATIRRRAETMAKKKQENVLS